MTTVPSPVGPISVTMAQQGDTAKDLVGRRHHSQHAADLYLQSGVLHTQNCRGYYNQPTLVTVLARARAKQLKYFLGKGHTVMTLARQGTYSAVALATRQGGNDGGQNC